MGKRKPTFCRETISLSLENGEIRGCTCNRPLPCLLHTPYRPEFPDEAEVGDPRRRATWYEIDTGRICANCVRSVEIHDNGGPTKGIACLLFDYHVTPRQSCDYFELPLIHTRETAFLSRSGVRRWRRPKH